MAKNEKPTDLIRVAARAWAKVTNDGWQVFFKPGLRGGRSFTIPRAVGIECQEKPGRKYSHCIYAYRSWCKTYGVREIDNPLLSSYHRGAK